MSVPTFRQLLLSSLLSLIFLPLGKAQISLDLLDRGLIAIPQHDHNFVSWRTFPGDLNEATAYRLLRDGSPVSATPITGVSHYVDTEGTANSEYQVEVLQNETVVHTTERVLPWAASYLEIPTRTPPDYTLNDGAIGDLDGDGRVEILVQLQKRSRDNSQSGETDPVLIHAYDLDGNFLWRINLGVNIRAGAHYTQMMVYDLDGDGRAELACKTAPGVRDGTSQYLSDGPAADDDDSANYRNSDGYILSGPEYLTVFEGTTGRELSTVYYAPGRHPTTENPTGGQLDAVWGDGYGNRVDRFLACVAHFEERPSLVMCRGYYTRTTLCAWDFIDGQLTQRWLFDTRGGDRNYEGQGAHCISVGDVDNDGKDEIMYGSMAIDHDGTPLYNTHFLDGDAGHLGDFIPDRPGLEYFMPLENAGDTGPGGLIPGVHLRDAATGEILMRAEANGDIGRGLTADISAEHPGNEYWASSGLGVFSSNGEQISNVRPSINFAIWWDGDLLRELLDGVSISKWSPSGAQNIFSAAGCASNNGTKSNPVFSGDILGDWREEVIFRTEDNQSLLLFSTTTPSPHRIPSLLFDKLYRQSLVWQNVAYNQPPHTGFFLGHGMDPVSVSELSPSTFQLYPNPNSGSFQLSLEDTFPPLKRLDIYRLDGSLVQQVAVTPANHQWQIEGLSSGVYLVVGQSDNGSIRKKVVVME